MSSKSIVRYRSNIHLLGTDKHTHNIFKALSALEEKSPCARSLIEELNTLNAQGNRNLEIFHGPFKVGCSCAFCSVDPWLRNAYNFDANGIIFDPTEKHRSQEGWAVATVPEINLGHELVHAYHGAKNNFHIVYESSFEKYIEELKTVGLGCYKDHKYTENAIRKDFGLPLRPRY